MASPPPPDPHLTLELTTHTHTTTDQTHSLEELLSRLEEERTKIDAFKRELPLCIQLLTNAVENSRERLEKRRLREEYKGGVRGEVEKSCWMSSVQLWSRRGGVGENEDEEKLSSVDGKKRTRGAFLPFCKDGGVVISSSSRDEIPELGLCSSSSTKDKGESVGGKIEEGHNNNNNQSNIMKCCPSESSGKEVQQNMSTAPAAAVTTSSLSNGHPHRKARRCWSPELHRRFINALQLLGGSQVATPKQIRELMKVEGLTNDEVKSHLQKYRLHTRRPGGVAQGGGSGGPQLVVLGGIWVPPEYAAAHGGAATIYSTHSSPPTFCTPPVPHEFYPVTPMTHALAHAHNHHHHHYQHHHQQEEEEEEVEYHRRMYNGCVEGGEGEESEDGGGGAKRGERNRVVSRRSVVMEEGDESNNVCEITLKV